MPTGTMHPILQVNGIRPNGTLLVTLASSDEGTCCEKPICDLDVRQKADRAERPDGLSASNCGRNKSYRILLGLVELRVGRQGLLLDSNCS